VSSLETNAIVIRDARLPSTPSIALLGAAAVDAVHRIVGASLGLS
jgi:hypothetical protein